MMFHYQQHYSYNIIGDELLLNFGAKFQRLFVISQIAMSTFRTSQCQDGAEVLKCHE